MYRRVKVTIVTIRFCALHNLPIANTAATRSRYPGVWEAMWLELHVYLGFQMQLWVRACSGIEGHLHHTVYGLTQPSSYHSF